MREKVTALQDPNHFQKEPNMKRIILAASFAVFAAPVLAASGAPFEQTQLDRGQPTATQNDNASSGASYATGVWANDYNFIAPAQ